MVLLGVDTCPYSGLGELWASKSAFKHRETFLSTHKDKVIVRFSSIPSVLHYQTNVLLDDTHLLSAELKQECKVSFESKIVIAIQIELKLSAIKQRPMYGIHNSESKHTYTKQKIIRGYNIDQSTNPETTVS